MSEELRPIDGNGFTPDEPQPVAGIPPEHAGRSLEWQAGYQACAFEFITRGLAECQRILSEALEKVKAT